MSALIAIVGSIFAFFIVVVVHEFGHFIVARRMKIKVLRFSIGFGKPIWSHVAKSGVEYVIGFLPLGGYVKMQDAFSALESKGNNAGSEGDAFEHKSLLARAAVVVAGPAANIVLAIIIFTLVYTIGITQMKPIVADILPHSIASMAQLQQGDQIIQTGRFATRNWQAVTMELISHMGDSHPLSLTVLPKNSPKLITKYLNLAHWQLDPIKPDLFKSLGFKPYFPKIPPRIFSIAPHSPASKSELRVNDLILAVNKTPVDSWQTLVTQIENHLNKSVLITVQRNQSIKNITVMITEKNHHGFLGISPKPIKIPPALQYKQQYSLPYAVLPAMHETHRWIRFQFAVLKQMLTGKISLKTMGGPVSVFQTAGVASLAGLTTYLQFIAFISVVIGVLNILPIPALDGGHLLFCVVEALIRRPIPVRIQVLLVNIGIAFLLMLMVYATSNDLLRLLG